MVELGPPSPSLMLLSAVRDHRFKSVAIRPNVPLIKARSQLSHAESKIRQLDKSVQAMQAERDAMKNEEGRDKAWRERFDALTSEMQQLKAALNASNPAPASTKTPRERQRLARFGINIRRFGFCQ